MPKLRPRLSPLASIGICFATLACAVPAAALTYTGAANQFAGGFSPSNTPYGGFGGGSCTATRTPVVYIHGNGDEARNWDYPPSTGVRSVYDEMRFRGYNDCELFGVNWLSSSERGTPQLNYHTLGRADMVADFIVAVKAYTGKSQVDVVSHSMGVTVALHGIERFSLWGSVRRFVGIGGGLRGLTNCLWVGYANPYYPTCGSQNVFNSDIFGFYPHSASTWNPRTGDGGFRDYPSGKATIFYTIRADIHDQVLCGTASSVAGCDDSALFDARANVRAQLDVGYGTPAAGLDYDLADWTYFNTGGGDTDGVGHFRSKNNTGIVQYNMLSGTCTTTGCCTGYGDVCGN
jgi:pimeloyl-ACP methyl ester carboxylesterase